MRFEQNRMRSHCTPTLMLSSYSPLQLVIWLLIITLLAIGLLGNVSAISSECKRFCEARRRQYTNGDGEFMILCETFQNLGNVRPGHCPGQCVAYNCDDELCGDGIHVKCPSRRDLNRKPYKERERKPSIDPTVLIIVLAVIGAIVIICIAVGIYIYVSYVHKRRRENLNRYQLQAPRSTSSQNPPTQTPPQSRQPPTPTQTSQKIALSTHYMASETDGVQNISTGQSNNFDYTVQPQR